MKTLAFLVLAGSGLLACQRKGSAMPAATVGPPFSVAYQQTVILPLSPTDSVRVAFTKVDDSRCPEGGQCVWAGDARVAVLLTENTASQTVRLGLGINKTYSDYLPDSIIIMLNHRDYWLRLLDVTPYPSTKGTSSPKMATLRLLPNQ